jgi:hypothetical protein
MAPTASGSLGPQFRARTLLILDKEKSGGPSPPADSESNLKLGPRAGKYKFHLKVTNTGRTSHESGEFFHESFDNTQLQSAFLPL